MCKIIYSSSGQKLTRVMNNEMSKYIVIFLVVVVVNSQIVPWQQVQVITIS